MLNSSVSLRISSCRLSTVFSVSCLSLSIISFFFARFLRSSFRSSACMALRASKKWLQAVRKSSQSWSPNRLGTIPIVFHSFCRAMSLSDVFFQSVESFNACAFSTSSCLRFAFSAYFSFSSLKYSPFFVKNSSHAARKRSKILVFIFWGVKPMVFHSCCKAMISFDWLSQSPVFLRSCLTMSSTFSQSAVFLTRFSSSSARISSKCCWCRLLITVLAALKRCHICSRSSFSTGPVSRYSWCKSCSWWKALMTSCSSASFSAASQSCVFFSRFFLKSYSRASRLRFSKS